MALLLELDAIHKRFGFTIALDGVSLAVREGTVHALLGENGAGKTTLMRVAYGLIQPDAGAVRLDGSAVRLRSPGDAMARGIGMVHQHFTLVPAMTVAENVALAQRGRYDAAHAVEQVRQVAARTNLEIDPTARVEALGVAAQQRCEIVKALAGRARLLILDEPTAVLAPNDAEELGRWMREFRDGGGTVVLITHKLREALRLADDVTVLRHGRTVLTGEAERLTADGVVEAMLGSRPVSAPPHPRRTVVGAPIATARGLWLNDERDRVAIRDASLEIGAGEIVGVAALEGSGHHALLRALAGRTTPARGSLYLPTGIAFVPEDRHGDALALDLSVRENVALRGAGRRRGRIPWRHIDHSTRELIARYDIRGATPALPARALSGGNQQRLVLARELADDPNLVVAENPAHGLDVRATAAVYDALRAAAERGAAVVVHVGDLDELLGLADRVLVVVNGSVRAVAAERESVGRAMIGEA